MVLSVSKIGLVCEHRTLIMKCPNGEVLDIKSAQYGRRRGDTRICQNGSVRKYANRIKSFNCRSRSSLTVVRANCYDRNRCSIVAKNNVFGDPCRFIYKYLKVDYQCISGKS